MHVLRTSEYEIKTLNFKIHSYISLNKTYVQYFKYYSLGFPFKIQPCDYLTKKYYFHEKKST